ncbi:hypothetical protein AGOR_G00022380 [Albula goreensis]|uniref:Uncharacterized protein n=1 Tax=Albula goreensis TaxID=1534307 RepID=A0A8T3E861_9TELE|nr:hypothetical protein AGOR_G00022380 [Albula goreensis]
MKQLNVVLPAAFHPVLIMELNMAAVKEMGEGKYPGSLLVSNRDTMKGPGLQYAEQGCCPVPLTWDMYKTQKMDLTPVAVVSLQKSHDHSSVPALVSFPLTGPILALAVHV